MNGNGLASIHSNERNALNPLRAPIGIGMPAGLSGRNGNGAVGAVSAVARVGGVGGVGSPGGGYGNGATVHKASQTARTSFHEELKKAQSSVKFSKHAETRLKTRNIELTEEQSGKLSTAIDKARDKGLRDTLVVLDGIALVANVRSRTIVTAVSRNELEQNVFTNIDGAVFA